MKTTGSCLRFPVVLLAGMLSACNGETPPEVEPAAALPPVYKQAKYATLALTPDLQALSADERQAVPLLVTALEAIDRIFWRQVYGPREAFLESISDPDALRFARINYGPWDRLDENRPFLPVLPRPATGKFYPLNLLPGELDQAGAASADGGASLRDPYTVVRRTKSKQLQAIPFHEFYAEPVGEAAAALRQAAETLRNPSLRRYLELRAGALTTDSYAASEEVWLEIDSPLGVAIGPLDGGEDHYYRSKRAYTGALWIRRPQWDSRLQRIRSQLPELAAELSVGGLSTGDSPLKLEVVDLIAVAGSWNAGPKRIVLELPVDERLRAKSGARRLLLRNVARAKYDETLVPLADALIVPEQRGAVTFDAFFDHDLLQEMVRIDRESTEWQALRRLYADAAWVVEVVRANAIGFRIAGRLAETGESDSTWEELCATTVASSFRSLRFGSSSAQGPAALILLNWLRREGAIGYAAGEPTYRIDVEKMRRSMRELAVQLAAADDPAKASALTALFKELTAPDPDLLRDLERLAVARVPIDVAFSDYDPGR